MRKTELKELYKMMFPDYPDIVTVAQLQQMLGVSRHLAYDLINNGYISGVKIGNAFKIPKVNVINYVMEEGENNRGGHAAVNADEKNLICGERLDTARTKCAFGFK